jgi:hypothetical protein
MHKHFPHVKTYVRAHDINHGLNLEKAGVRLEEGGRGAGGEPAPWCPNAA